MEIMALIPAAGQRTGADAREGGRFMREKVRDFFVIPREILPEFWETALSRNRVSLLVICIMIFGMELFNMARVLLWSNAGLGTLNNRIYFGFYLSLFLAAAVCMAFGCGFRGRVPGRLIQYGSVLFFLLWHICINAYDLYRDPNAEIGLYLTAILGISVFILMPAKLACFMHGSAYLLFMLLAGGIITAGDRVNLTCTAIVALAVSLTNSHHYATILSQQKKIRRTNEDLRDMAQRDPLTGLLNKCAFQGCVEAHPQLKGMALMIADLDDFKRINDQYGHPCGDHVLKEVSAKIAEAFPDAAGIGRIGGDEFGLLVDAAEEARLESSVRHLIRGVSAITWHGTPLEAGCSFGVCRIGRSGAAYEQLYAEADRALYRAKGNGKNQLSVSRLD